jgi:hypothetical protein
VTILSFLLNDKDFESLGSKDFSRALAVAREIHMKEASALAQLAVCRGALIKRQTTSAPQTNLHASQKEQDNPIEALGQA